MHDSLNFGHLAAGLILTFTIMESDMMEGLWGISREDGFNGANVLVDVRTKHVRMNIYPLPRK